MTSQHAAKHSPLLQCAPAEAAPEVCSSSNAAARQTGTGNPDFLLAENHQAYLRLRPCGLGLHQLLIYAVVMPPAALGHAYSAAIAAESASAHLVALLVFLGAEHAAPAGLAVPAEAFVVAAPPAVGLAVPAR